MNHLKYSLLLRSSGLEDEIEILAEAGDIVYYHPFLVHGASPNMSTDSRKVLFTHYYPGRLDEAVASRRQRELSWMTQDALEERFHAEHLDARRQPGPRGDAHFWQLVSADGWSH